MYENWNSYPFCDAYSGMFIAAIDIQWSTANVRTNVTLRVRVTVAVKNCVTQSVYL